MKNETVQSKSPVQAPKALAGNSLAAVSGGATSAKDTGGTSAKDTGKKTGGKG